MRSGNLYIEAATREIKQATSAGVLRNAEQRTCKECHRKMAIINPAYSRKTKGPHCRWCGAVPTEAVS